MKFSIEVSTSTLLRDLRNGESPGWAAMTGAGILYMSLLHLSFIWSETLHQIERRCLIGSMIQTFLFRTEMQLRLKCACQESEGVGCNLLLGKSVCKDALYNIDLTSSDNRRQTNSSMTGQSRSTRPAKSRNCYSPRNTSQCACERCDSRD